MRAVEFKADGSVREVFYVEGVREAQRMANSRNKTLHVYSEAAYKRHSGPRKKHPDFFGPATYVFRPGRR